MIDGRHVMAALLLGGAVFWAGAARADQPVAPGCAKIVAVLDESGAYLEVELRLARPLGELEAALDEINAALTAVVEAGGTGPAPTDS